jgi:hypothetical protein
MPLITRETAGTREKLALLAQVGKLEYLTQRWIYNPVADKWSAPGRSIPARIEASAALAELASKGIDQHAALCIVGELTQS